MTSQRHPRKHLLAEMEAAETEPRAMHCGGHKPFFDCEYC